MTHRCSVCDWSPYTTSLFQSSLPHYPSRLVIVDETVYCNICLEVVEDLIQEDNDEYIVEFETLDDVELTEPTDSGEEVPSLS
jgi:hypothetical protein